MCGLVGILGLKGPDPERSAIVRRMTATLVHRGPDGEGFRSAGACELGFRRLAIIDVEARTPPFSNEDGTVWSVCNGQIYNSTELTRRLEQRGHRFRTGVDTEVIPHLYEEHGADLVDHLNGMFTAAVWDEPGKTLILGRDRAGEKPLFYWRDDNELVFASELRALLAHPRVPDAVNPVGLRRFLLHDYFPAPLSPIAGVNKLPAGHVMIVREGEVRVRCYWDLAEHFGKSGSLSGRSIADVEDELDQRLSVAVRRRRRSDVPVGVFLSGGIDSSTILAHFAEQAGDGVPVFALGHTEGAFDESRYARETARHFGADFHELVLGEADLAEGLRLVGEGFDEPLGDSSIIPTHLLARFARQKVKVVLSGEGADELFGGYPTYIGNRVADLFQKIPRPLRRALMQAARKLTPVSMGNVGLDYLLERFSTGAEQSRIERHHRWFGSLGPDRIRAVLAPRVLDALEHDDPFGSAKARVAGKGLPDGLAELLYSDFTMYLQDDLLTKVDRATMLTSLEARAPFLDHDLAEFVAGLPSRLKVRGLTTKAILRRAVASRLPRQVLQRRKRGFSIPFSRWLLHGLGQELRQRFSTERVAARGLLSPSGVRCLLDEHLQRQRDHRKPLFTLLALDLWCDRTYGAGQAVPIAAAVAPPPLVENAAAEA